MLPAGDAAPPSCGPRPRRRALTLVAAAVLLAGCSVPLPDVGFYGNGTAVTSGPSLWCGVDQGATQVQCSIDIADVAAARLSLRPGQGIVVSVPSEIGNQPWTVVFRYTDASGRHDARSAVFPAGSRLAYTLQAPTAAAQIDRIEVQSGLTLVQGTNGGVDVAVLRSWVLVVTPEAARA